MPRINVKLDDVQSNRFELFPEELFPVEIQPSTSLKQSDAGPYIQIIAKCIEGEMEGKPIGWRCYLKEDALWNLKGMLEVIGLEWDEDGFELEELFEAKLIIENSHRVYEGETFNNIKGYYPYK